MAILIQEPNRREPQCTRCHGLLLILLDLQHLMMLPPSEYHHDPKILLKTAQSQIHKALQHYETKGIR